MKNVSSGLLLGIVLGVISCTAVTVLSAQSKPESAAQVTGKVGTIDVVRAFNELQRQKDLDDELRQIRERLELENQTRQQKIDATRATVDAMDPNDPAYGTKLRELQQLQIDYKTWFEVNQAGIAREVALWTSRIYVEIAKAVGEVATQQGIDVVTYREEFMPPGLDPDGIRNTIRQRKVVWSSDACDLTMQVVDKLNTAYRAQPKQKMIQVP